jgi:hypothetical protein
VTREQQAVLEVVRDLERLRIPHMVTGTFASSYHGRPRATHDAAIVIDPQPEQLEALVESLAAEGFTVDAARARESLGRRLVFDVIDPRSALKVDLVMLKNRPWSREELARRQPAALLPGVQVALASPEDTVLCKLEWAKRKARSSQQLDDAAGVIAVNPAADRGYIEKWARELDVLDLWQEIAGG